MNPVDTARPAPASFPPWPAPDAVAHTHRIDALPQAMPATEPQRGAYRDALCEDLPDLARDRLVSVLFDRPVVLPRPTFHHLVSKAVAGARWLLDRPTLWTPAPPGLPGTAGDSPVAGAQRPDVLCLDLALAHHPDHPAEHRQAFFAWVELQSFVSAGAVLWAAARAASRVWPAMGITAPDGTPLASGWPERFRRHLQGPAPTEGERWAVLEFDPWNQRTVFDQWMLARQVGATLCEPSALLATVRAQPPGARHRWRVLNRCIWHTGSAAERDALGHLMRDPALGWHSPPANYHRMTKALLQHALGAPAFPSHRAERMVPLARWRDIAERTDDLVVKDPDSYGGQAVWLAPAPALLDQLAEGPGGQRLLAHRRFEPLAIDVDGGQRKRFVEFRVMLDTTGPQPSLISVFARLSAGPGAGIAHASGDGHSGFAAVVVSPPRA